jgi:hypothetical protein
MYNLQVDTVHTMDTYQEGHVHLVVKPIDKRKSNQNLVENLLEHRNSHKVQEIVRIHLQYLSISIQINEQQYYD